MYNEPDIFLFDDSLSSLDQKIARDVIEKSVKNYLYSLCQLNLKNFFRIASCLKGYLKGKTRILVTNSIGHLRYADRIYVLENVIKIGEKFLDLYFSIFLKPKGKLGKSKVL